MFIRFFTVSVLIFMAVICDKRTYKIPNWIIVIGSILGLFMVLFDFFQGLDVWDYFKGWIGMFIILFGIFLINGLGAGDVKLMMTIGLIMGWEVAWEMIQWISLAVLFLGILSMIKNRESKLHKMHMSYAIGIGLVLEVMMKLV